MIKGYIFDYGGTLDTEGHHWGKVLWHSYQRQHVPVTEEQFREAYVYGERTLGNVPIIKPDYTFHKTLDTKLRLEMEYICCEGFWNAGEEDMMRMHNAVLEDVYSYVIKVTDHSREVLKEFKLDHLFQDIVESAVVGIRKPDARIYKLGVEKLGLKPEEVMVVGDSFYKDIEPANKIGCETTWFKGEGWTDKVYDETLPDKIITDIVQLLQ